MGIQDSLFRILVAEEPVIDVKNNKQVERMQNMFPGYVFVEMIMTDDAWYVVRNTPGVTGFIGSSGGGAKPFPVSPVEMESILRRMGQSEKKVVVDFAVGDTVRILAGPFSGMEGRVNAMNDQTQTASVLTMLFGRETPTDISYNDLQRVTD
jgi:transcriptional antiterminator NusG